MVGNASYSADQVLLEPDSPFVAIHAAGGSTHEVRSYFLRGDGQVTILSTSNASSSPELVYTEQVSAEDVDAAVRAIFSGALYEFDLNRVKAKHLTEPHPGPSIEDAGSLRVEIHLPLFPGSNPSGADELTHVFGVNVSDMAEGHFPSIREYAALRQIFGILRQAERRARSAWGRPEKDAL